MNERRARPVLRSLLAVAAILATLPAGAEEIEKKWRLSLSVGGFNPQDEIRSNAGNTLTIRNPTTLLPAEIIADPRDDSEAFGNLDVKAGVMSTLAVQYALSKVLLIEGSVGYGKSDIGDVEVSAQFFGDQQIIDQIPFFFQTYRVGVGELTRVPIHLSALARLRPRARFNPYFGAGIGYEVHGLELTPEFNDLSRRIDDASGALIPVTPVYPGTGSFGTPLTAPQDLTGAVVDARDSFLWQAAVGAELSLRKKWAAFLDLRWVQFSRDVFIGFNGGAELGKSVPQFEDVDGSPISLEEFGPMQISQGGLIDAGRRDSNGRFIAEPDGVPDPGLYFVQGGKLSLDGFSLSLGVRYTF